MPAGDVWGNSWLSTWGTSWKQAVVPPVVVTTETPSGGWEVFARRRKTRRELEQEERLRKLPEPVQEIVEDLAQQQAEAAEQEQRKVVQRAVANELRERLAKQDLQFRKEYMEVLRGEIERLLYEAEEEKVIGMFLDAM